MADQSPAKPYGWVEVRASLGAESWSAIARQVGERYGPQVPAQVLSAAGGDPGDPGFMARLARVVTFTQ